MNTIIPSDKYYVIQNKEGLYVSSFGEVSPRPYPIKDLQLAKMLYESFNSLGVPRSNFKIFEVEVTYKEVL